MWRALIERSLGPAGAHPALRAALHDPTYYHTLLRRRGRSTHTSVRRLIHTDAKRTFSDHRHARRLQASCARVLDAYSHRNPQLGYCQSMNFLAGALLLFMREGAAFWCLCMLLEKILPESMYAAQLQGTTVELRVLCDLLSRSHGTLLSHLHRHQLSIDACCSRWLMTCFITVLPLPAALRIWDLLLLDAACKADAGGSGPSAVPLVGCVSLLALQAPRLLALHDADLLLQALLSLPAQLSIAQLDALCTAIARFVAGGSLDAHMALGQQQLSPLREMHRRVVDAELSLRGEGSLPSGAEAEDGNAGGGNENDGAATAD